MSDKKNVGTLAVVTDSATDDDTCLDLSDFVESNMDDEVLAYSHSLDLLYHFLGAGRSLCFSDAEFVAKVSKVKEELVRLMDAPNDFTLLDLARIEIALDVYIDFGSKLSDND